MLKILSIITATFLSLSLTTVASAGTPQTEKVFPNTDDYVSAAAEIEKDLKIEPLHRLQPDDLVIVTAPHHVARNIETLEDYTLLFRGTQLTTFTLEKQNASTLKNTFNNVTVETLTEIETPTTTQTPTPSWGLDRLDSPTVLDNQYTYDKTGNGVIIYIVDTGINNTGNQFGDRLVSGYDHFGDGVGTGDCQGHGTAVAGTAASTTYGVAKNATVVSVRILDCENKGTSLSLVAGLSWIMDNHPGGPAVINMSVSTETPSGIINNASKTASDEGFVVVAAAGNDAHSACLSSPASEPTTITVAASNINNQFASFSNFGECVDIIAPGLNIPTVNFEPTPPSVNASGTSIASPHVAGVAAILLEHNSNLNPQQIDTFIKQLGTKNVITDVPEETPNLFLTLNINRLVFPSFTLSTNFTSWNINEQATGTATITPNTAYSNDAVLTVAGVPTGVNHVVDGNTVTFTGTPTTAGTYTISYTLNEGLYNRTINRNVTVVDPSVVIPRVNLSQNYFTIERTKSVNLSTNLSTNTAFTNPTITVSAGLPPGIRATVRGGQILLTGTTIRNGTFRANVTATEGETTANRVITVVVTNPTYAPLTPRPVVNETATNVNLNIVVPKSFFRPTQYSIVLSRNGNIIATQTVNVRRATETVNYTTQTLTSNRYTVTVVARNSEGQSRPAVINITR